ncbi:MAG: dihydroorotate dehydrogenase [Oscillospiraceae bacterium]|nr:dihydroorotate dehydrogenase [Oscillospiraceae bacterium]
MADLSVRICGIDFKNPIIPASGVFGYGKEYEQYYPLSELGGIATKGTTGAKRTGNLPPRVAETPMGMLNSVGLQNPGIDHFIAVELPHLLSCDTVILANIAGSTPDECAEVAAKLDSTDVHMIELNISCPNVKQGGAAFGTSCTAAAEVTRAVRRATKKPLVVKLSPNVTSITEIAKAVEAEGADALSLINTLLGMRIDLRTRRPILHNNMGGLSGPAVFPVAVRMVWQVANAVKVPVIGMGGVMSGEDAAELMMAGASAVQVGTAIVQDPYAPLRIIDELNAWLDANGIASAAELTGTVRPW